MKLRYNEFHGELTRNNIKVVGGRIETLDINNIDGITTCDFLLPPNLKVKRIKECKYIFSKFHFAGSINIIHQSKK